MQCKIEEHELNQPAKCHKQIHLHLNDKAWPTSVQDCFRTFCISKSIHKLNISTHHILLRSILGDHDLPLLTVNKGLQGQWTFSSIVI
jgi:hypothetical protein